jgi:hypothetical protein
MIFIDKVKNRKISQTLLRVTPVSYLSACEPAETNRNSEAEGHIIRSAFLSLWAACVCAGYPFDTHQQKFFLSPLNFENIVLLFPVAYGIFVYFFCRKINNGILEVLSIRGWFKANCLLFAYIHILSPNKLAATEV